MLVPIGWAKRMPIIFDKPGWGKVNPGQKFVWVHKAEWWESGWLSRPRETNHIPYMSKWAPPRGFRFAGKFCPETNQRRRCSGIGALWLSSPETKERPPFFLDELVNFFLFSQAQQRWVYFTMGNCCRRMQGKQVTGTMFIRKAVPDNFKLCNPDQNL